MSSNKIFNADDLRGLLVCGCDTIGCEHQPEWLHAKCHIAGRTHARIVKVDNNKLGIEIVCGECERHIIKIAVAEQDP